MLHLKLQLRTQSSPHKMGSFRHIAPCINQITDINEPRKRHLSTSALRPSVDVEETCTPSIREDTRDGRPVSDFTDGRNDSNQSGDGARARAHNIAGLDLRREDHRLRTMRTWPARIMVDYEKAAKYGLYYAGTDDLLKCVFCDVGIHSWRPHDDPLVEHKKWSESCPHQRYQQVGNVPLFHGRDERGPSHPAFKMEDARLASFTNWPGRMRQRPAELADAGFYYTGQGDQTTCFYCGGGLKDWEDEDLPWEQHAMWFGLCPYLLTVKSERYVFEVKQRLSSAESSPLPKPESKPAPTVVTQMNDRSVDYSKLCGICCEGERNICIMPCGHVFTCGKCTMSINTCPVCIRPIHKYQRLYF